MGARAQVLIKDEGVYLYTHYGSSELVHDVRKALRSEAGKDRWGDSEYLARIIFDVMKDGDTTGSTGYGIGTQAHSDLDYAPIEVDCANQTVKVKGAVKSFTDFIKEL